MKKILISMVAALALLPVFTSCSNDDDNKPEKTAAQSVEANYVGGTYANCKYFQNYQPTENDTVFVKATQTADVATLSYTSATWGEFTFEAVKVTKQNDGSFTLAGGYVRRTCRDGWHHRTVQPCRFQGSIRSCSEQR